MKQLLYSSVVAAVLFGTGCKRDFICECTTLTTETTSKGFVTNNTQNISQNMRYSTHAEAREACFSSYARETDTISNGQVLTTITTTCSLQ